MADRDFGDLMSGQFMGRINPRTNIDQLRKKHGDITLSTRLRDIYEPLELRPRYKKGQSSNYEEEPKQK